MSDPAKITDFDKEDPLKIVEGETTKANQALFDYAQMGVARSLKKLVDKYQKQDKEWREYKQNPQSLKKGDPIPQPVPAKGWTTISNWSGEFLWQERVKKYDELERERQGLEFQSERLKWKKQRIDLAKAMFTKTAQAMASLNPKDAQWRDVSATFKTVMEQLRLEFGDEVNLEGGGTIVRVIEIKKTYGEYGDAGGYIEGGEESGDEEVTVLKSYSDLDMPGAVPKNEEEGSGNNEESSVESSGETNG